MSLILQIDTAIEGATVSLAQNGVLLRQKSNNNQKDHAAFLQPAIQELFNDGNLSLQQLEAVAVSSGPGSYTGLRVGFASAKGLCYALKIPLITVDTLALLAWNAICEWPKTHTDPLANSLICPMIDARRQEVFTAVYNARLELLEGPSALILTKESYAKNLLNNNCLFTGNGAAKWQEIGPHSNAVFFQPPLHPQYLAELAFKQFGQNQFADLAYSEPFYLKEFYHPNNA